MGRNVCAKWFDPHMEMKSAQRSARPITKVPAGWPPPQVFFFYDERQEETDLRMDEAEDVEIARARLALSIFNLEMIFDRLSLSRRFLIGRHWRFRSEVGFSILRVTRRNTRILSVRFDPRRRTKHRVTELSHFLSIVFSAR